MLCHECNPRPNQNEKIFSLSYFSPKMQTNALLAWESFMVQKVGVIDLPPLKGISPLRFGCVGKKLYVVYCKFFFMLRGSFIFGVVTPLYFAHLDDLTMSHSLCGIQDPDWLLAVH
jgi:hypothetical protein